MPDYTLVLSTKALHDIRKAFSWYDDIGENLKLQLIDELDFYYNRILNNPKRYGYYPVIKNFRRVRLKQFPFYILYRIDDEIIRIAGIVHTSRSPAFMRRRYF